MLDTREQLSTHLRPRPHAPAGSQLPRLGRWSPAARAAVQRVARKLAAALDELAGDDPKKHRRQLAEELRAGPWTATPSRRAREAHRREIARAGEHCDRASAVLSCGHASVGYDSEGRMLKSASGVPVAVVDKCGHRLCVDCASQLARRRMKAVVERLRELELRTALVGPVRTLPPRTSWRHLSTWQVAMARFRALVRTRAQSAAKLVDELSNDATTSTAYTFALGELGGVKKTRASRRRPQRRPYSVPDVREVVVASTSRGMTVAGERRATRRRRVDGRYFRIGPPPPPPRGEGRRRATGRGPMGTPPGSSTMPLHDVYGCRFATFTQPPRDGESLLCAIERLVEARRRLFRSPVWKGHVDAAVDRIEFTRSTPSTRRKLAAEKERDGLHDEAARLRAEKGRWWHVHLHALIWGSFFPATPEVAVRAGREREDSLLMVWRRALVESGTVDDELRAADIDADGLRAQLRQWSHAGNGCQWALPLLGLVGGERSRPERMKLGGVHVKIPVRQDGTPWRSVDDALHEVVKYVTKPAELAALSHDDVVDAVRATERRRMISCTGLLYGLHMPEEDDENAAPDVEGLTDDAWEAPARSAWTVDGERVVERDIRWSRFDDLAANEERRAAWELRGEGDTS